MRSLPVVNLSSPCDAYITIAKRCPAKYWSVGKRSDDYSAIGGSLFFLLGERW